MLLAACTVTQPTPAPTRVRDGVPPAESPEQIAAARKQFELAVGRPLPTHFPTPREPSNNPTTREKIELGRWLFYDMRLSGNGMQACGSCHVQARAFTDGRVVALGSTGVAHPRNTMTLANVAYNSTFNWANPNLTEIEAQARIPLLSTNPVEMGSGGQEGMILERLKIDQRYPAFFASAFPGQRDPVSWDNIEYALGAFVRSLISSNSPYDRYVEGNASTLSAAALRGKSLFESEALGCTNCHNGFNFSTATVWRGSPSVKPFFNTGLYNVAGTGYPANNRGLAEYTGLVSDTGKMRPPTLRNLRYTAPYGHDGSVATLETVIRNYARGGRGILSGLAVGDGKLNPYKSALISGFNIDEDGIADLLAFLDALNDPGFVRDPAFSDPTVR